MPITMTTAAGFTPTTEDDEVTYLNGQFSQNVGAGIDLDPDQPLGQIIGIFAKEYQQATELLATAFNMVNPNAAEGVLLANVCAITGTVPEVATYGTVQCTLTLAPGTTVPAGSIVYVTGQPTNTWTLLSSVTYGGTTGNWTSPAVTFQSTQAGAIAAPLNTVTAFGSPVAGWISVTNVADAVEGHPADTDTTLRLRQAEELAGSSQGNLASVRAAVAAVIEPNYTGFSNTVWVYENTTSEPDANGVPGHSIHVVYWDGATHPTPYNSIAQAIWDHKSAGVGTFGTLSGTATDALGSMHTVYFDVGTAVNIYVNLVTTPTTVTSGTTAYAAITTAVQNYVQATWNFGTPANIIPLVSAALDALGTGVTDIPQWQIDTVNPPVATGNITMQPYQIAVLAGLTVNGT
jgi:uncharacterized phage protein gp47/JayE